MLGKIRKTLKKVAGKDPLVKHTSKVLAKTGGPAGKAIAKTMTGGSSKRAPARGAAGGTGPTTLGSGVPVSSGKGGAFSKGADGAMQRLARRKGLQRR